MTRTLQTPCFISSVQDSDSACRIPVQGVSASYKVPALCIFTQQWRNATTLHFHFSLPRLTVILNTNQQILQCFAFALFLLICGTKIAISHSMLFVMAQGKLIFVTQNLQRKKLDCNSTLMQSKQKRKLLFQGMMLMKAFLPQTLTKRHAHHCYTICCEEYPWHNRLIVNQFGTIS